MWFSTVEIPDTVVDAQQTGSLVFFIGAGAWVAALSDLPPFGGLTEWVARQAGVPGCHNSGRSRSFL
jgi:hypothetical protein